MQMITRGFFFKKNPWKVINNSAYFLNKKQIRKKKPIYD